jgi:acyl-CoA thioesterase-1
MKSLTFRHLFTLTLLIWTLPAHAVTILCLGDSLTEGFGVGKNDAWPAVAEKILKDKKKDVTLVNAGISGSTTASGPSRLTWHLKSKHRADWLFLALGANDGLRGQDVQAAKENLKKTIHQARDAGMKKIILAGMKLPPNYGPFTPRPLTPCSRNSPKRKKSFSCHFY